MFAAAAALVERSGAYRFVIAPADQGGSDHKDDFGLGALQGDPWPMIARAWALGLYPTMTRQGSDWSKYVDEARPQYPPMPEDQKLEYKQLFSRDYYSFDELMKVDTLPLGALWNKLYVDHGDEPVVAQDGDRTEIWWEIALKLLILADMASVGVGFRRLRRGGKESAESIVQKEVLAKAVTAAKGKPSKPYLTTITEVVDPGFCSVLPKTRTAALGCTLRSLSHNLSYLPSPGLVEARWRIPGHAPPSPIDTGDMRHPARSLNLLLIPFPWKIRSKCFEGRKPASSLSAGWSYFDLKQRWLPEPDSSDFKEMVRFLCDLVADAADDLDGIHGVVFPECSLNAATYDAICKELLRNREETKFEFIVAGISEEPKLQRRRAVPPRLRKGNFVSVRAVGANRRAGWGVNSAREKHHRWKLNKPQIERYGLSSQLDPMKNWWEAIPLSRRVVDFFEPRAGTSMTVLICEDLARADPCQAVVRSVGPNLVLALLLDGPQRKSRWPGHYAGVLADDPGSSVLTLTSLGLIARGAASDESQSRSVAFFRNSLGQERELFVPSGFHALAVRLTTGDAKTEHTLDGRGDGNAAYIWSLNEVSPVRGRTHDRNKWIVEDMR